MSTPEANHEHVWSEWEAFEPDPVALAWGLAPMMDIRRCTVEGCHAEQFWNYKVTPQIAADPEMREMLRKARLHAQPHPTAVGSMLTELEQLAQSVIRDTPGAQKDFHAALAPGMVLMLARFAAAAYDNTQCYDYLTMSQAGSKAWGDLEAVAESWVEDRKQ